RLSSRAGALTRAPPQGGFPRFGRAPPASGPAPLEPARSRTARRSVEIGRRHPQTPAGRTRDLPPLWTQVPPRAAPTRAEERSRPPTRSRSGARAPAPLLFPDRAPDGPAPQARVRALARSGCIREAGAGIARRGRPPFADPRGRARSRQGQVRPAD